MKYVILDGKEMISIDAAHEYLADKLNLPEYYGGNLDALWDILSTISEPIKIVLENEDKMIFNLGGYAELLLNVLYEAVEFNKNITFNAEDSGC